MLNPCGSVRSKNLDGCWIWLGFEAIALANLGEYQLELGRQDEAEQHASASLDLATRMADGQNMVFAMAALALTSRARGDDRRAGRIWGAIEAESARAPIGRWESTYRQRYEREVLHGAGEDFGQGFQEGLHLTLDAAATSLLDRRGAA